MNCSLIRFKDIGDEIEGFLIPIEAERNVTFQIKRVYYIYGVKQDVIRGYHAHKSLEQVLICVNGSVKIKVDDGTETEIITLDKPHTGCYIGPGIWREMYEFSQNSVLLVIASAFFDENDYIRDYNDFVQYKKTQKI